MRRKAVEFDAELESHIAMDVRGADACRSEQEEARREALMRLGGAEQARQAYRERATLPPLESFLQDVRFASAANAESAGFHGDRGVDAVAGDRRERGDL